MDVLSAEDCEAIAGALPALASLKRLHLRLPMGLYHCATDLDISKISDMQQLSSLHAVYMPKALSTGFALSGLHYLRLVAPPKDIATPLPATLSHMCYLTSLGTYQALIWLILAMRLSLAACHPWHTLTWMIASGTM